MSFRACRMHHTDEGMAPHGMPSASMGAGRALKVWSPLAKTARGPHEARAERARGVQVGLGTS